MRVATYHRVSTFDQDPTLARGALQAHALRLGGAIALQIEETGSGARHDRPGLRRLFAAVETGEVDVVLCWKLDRFGRSALDLLANLRALDAAGVRFIAVSQGIDIRPGGDALSQLQVTILAAVAQFERDLIRERTALGMARARRLGKRLGRRRTRPTREAVHALRAQGRSWSQIAAALGSNPSAVRRAFREGGP